MRSRYATPWKRCHYCRVELRWYQREVLICDGCEALRRPIQKRAVDAVRRAVKAGRLPAPSAYQCMDCARPAAVYDHRDYGKPLCVEPVCRSCNGKRGPAECVMTSRRNDAAMTQ
jgi:hypothetical protein